MRDPTTCSVAYTTSNGVARWVSRFHRDSQPEVLHAAALSPDGGTVYLTGSLATAADGENPANALTIAMNVSSGGSFRAHVITATLHDAIGRSVAVNPDGGTVTDRRRGLHRRRGGLQNRRAPGVHGRQLCQRRPVDIEVVPLYRCSR